MREIINLLLGLFGAARPIKDTNTTPIVNSAQNWDDSNDISEQLKLVNHCCSDNASCEEFFNEASLDNLHVPKNRYYGRTISEVDEVYGSGVGATGEGFGGRLVDSEFSVPTYPRHQTRDLNRFAPRRKDPHQPAIELLQSGNYIEAFKWLKVAERKKNIAASDGLMRCLFTQLTLPDYEQRRAIAEYICNMPVNRERLATEVMNFFNRANVQLGIHELLYYLQDDVWERMDASKLIASTLPNLSAKLSSPGYIRRLMQLVDATVAKLTKLGVAVDENALISSFSYVNQPEAQCYAFMKLLELFPSLVDSKALYVRVVHLCDQSLAQSAQNSVLGLVNFILGTANVYKDDYETLKVSIKSCQAESQESLDFDGLVQKHWDSLNTQGFIDCSKINEFITQLTTHLSGLPSDKECEDERIYGILRTLELPWHTKEVVIVDLCKALIDKSPSLCRTVFDQMFRFLSTNHQLSLLYHIYPLQLHNYSLPHLLDALLICFFRIDVYNSPILNSAAIAFVSGNIRNLETDIASISDCIVVVWPKLGDSARTFIRRALNSRNNVWRLGDKMHVLRVISECQKSLDHIASLSSQIQE